MIFISMSQSFPNWFSLTVWPRWIVRLNQEPEPGTQWAHQSAVTWSILSQHQPAGLPVERPLAPLQSNPEPVKKTCKLWTVSIHSTKIDRHPSMGKTNATSFLVSHWPCKKPLLPSTDDSWENNCLAQSTKLPEGKFKPSSLVKPSGASQPRWLK